MRGRERKEAERAEAVRQRMKLRGRREVGGRVADWKQPERVRRMQMMTSYNTTLRYKGL